MVINQPGGTLTSDVATFTALHSPAEFLQNKKRFASYGRLAVFVLYADIRVQGQSLKDAPIKSGREGFQQMNTSSAVAFGVQGRANNTNTVVARHQRKNATGHTTFRW